MNPYGYVCDLQVKKVTPAQSAIEQALLSLLEEKELNKISVKEICQRANVARSTFYTYYDVVDDCLFAMETRFLRGLMERNQAIKTRNPAERTDFSFFEESFRYMQENQRMLYLFLVKRYQPRFVDRWKDAIKYHLYHQIPNRLSPRNRELTLEVIASGAMGAYRHWVKEPGELDIAYVKQLLRRTLDVYAE